MYKNMIYEYNIIKFEGVTDNIIYRLSFVK
jgi:hypothetical protein